MAAATDVKVPDIGDFKDVPVIEVLIKPGDTVKAEDSLVTLESDKATLDVPSPLAGVVKEVTVKVGDKVSEGTLIARVDGGTAAKAAPSAAPAKTSVSPPPAPTSAPAGVAEVRVPDIGDFKDVPVIEVLVKVGDVVKAEDALVTLESDKATMDVPAPLSGTVASLSVKVGDKVSRRHRRADAVDGLGHRRSVGGVRDYGGGRSASSAPAASTSASSAVATASSLCNRHPRHRRRPASTKRRSSPRTRAPACASSPASAASISAASRAAATRAGS